MSKEKSKKDLSRKIPQLLLKKVKICGLTRYEDALKAAELGAWALGFVFYSKSPRYIEPVAVRKIINRLKQELGVMPLTVGVFVQETAASIMDICRQSGVQVAQLHWNGAVETARQIDLNCIRVVRQGLKNFQNGLVEAPAEELKYLNPSDWVLVDAFDSQQYGGTGKISDWNLAKACQSFGPVILSGGLTAENLCDAIDFVAPYAVDLSSGVELKPGVKCHKKLAELFERLKCRD